MSILIQYQVFSCERNEIRDFIEKHHYSKSINGIMSDYCFKLMDGESIIGACIFGKVAMANAWKKYVINPSDLIELRRLVCIDDTPKNTESYFISRCIKWIKNNTKIKKIVSYADPEYGHTGLIYQASNFKLVGKSQPGKVIIWNGKKYHDKTIRTKYNGKLKPFAQRVKKALDEGEAYYKNTVGKFIYIYEVRKEWAQ